MLFWLKKFAAFWLQPLTFCVVAIVAGLWLARSPRRARLGRVLAALGTGLLVLLGNNFVSVRLMRPLETQFPAMPELLAGAPAPAELAACRYVVVLGGGNGYSPGVAATSLLSKPSLGRLTEGFRLLRALPEARLVVSGPGSGGLDPHATVLARAAIALGVDPERILYIDQARDTEEEAGAVRRLVGPGPVALVTSAWHLPRAVALFRHAGVTAVPCPADYKTHAAGAAYFEDFLWEVTALERSTVAIRERAGYLWIWLRGKT
jgi:uncharacterized SAM-binding protein YcdF (DUF218 family)